MNQVLESLLSNAIVAGILAILVAGIGLFRPRPVILHVLWLIVLLKLVTPPLVQFELLSEKSQSALASRIDEFIGKGIATWLPEETIPTLPETEDFVEDSVAAGIEPANDLIDIPLPATMDAAGIPAGSVAGVRYPRVIARLPTVLAVVWGLGSAAWFLLAAVRLSRFRRQLGRTNPADEKTQRVVDEVADRLGLQRRPVVRLSDACVPPMLATYGRRGVVLLPTGLLRGLSSQQQSTIIAHELAHYRRGDHWVRWLEFAVMGLYWWYPIAWFARHQLQQAEESCCDAWVLRLFPDRGRGYAQALLATIDFLSDARIPAPVGASGFGRVHSLQRRLEMILKSTWRPDLSLVARLTLIAVALLVLPLAPRAFSQAVPAVPATTTIDAPVAVPPIPAIEPGTSVPAIVPATPAVPAPPRLPLLPAAIEPQGPSSTLVSPPVPVPPTPAIRPPSPFRPSVPTIELDGPITEFGSVAAQPPPALAATEPTAANDQAKSTEHRLNRLEAMMSQLLTEIRKQPSGTSNSSLTPATPAPARRAMSRTTGATGTAPPTTGMSGMTRGKLDVSRAEPKASQTDVQAKLVDLEYEIQSLELQLRRAQSMRELLHNQLKEPKPPATSTGR